MLASVFNPNHYVYAERERKKQRTKENKYVDTEKENNHV